MPSFVQGKNVGVKLWTDGVPVEEKAMDQLLNLAAMPFMFKQVTALPDVHWGMGATVGSVIATKGAIIPAAVGVDIGCVDLHTEYLSPTGWRRVVDYDGGMVMQYDPATGVGCLVKPSAYVVQECPEFLVFKSKYGINQRLTPDHKMLVYKIRGRGRVREAMPMQASDFENQHASLAQGLEAEIETTFSLQSSSSLPFTDAELRVQVMVHADCYLRGPKAILKVKNQRKVTRARQLLNYAGILYSESSWEDLTTFRFTPPILSKTYGLDWWSSSAEQLKIVTDEALHWDGDHGDKCFYTRSKGCADFMHYAFTVAGYRAVLRADDHPDGTVDYRVYQFTNTKVGLAGVPKTPVTRAPSEDGKAYCFTVESGYWVMRRGGNIAMTGNCGMAAVQTSLKASDLPDNLHGIRSSIEAAVPHGRTNNGGAGDRGAWGDIPERSVRMFSDLQASLLKVTDKHQKLVQAAERAPRHMGTLGTGNHFIELCLDEQQAVWVMLHSGSRGIGNAIGQYFIEQAKRDMERWFIQLPDKDLAYIPQGSSLFNDYFEAVHWAQLYAELNRKVMMQNVLNVLSAAFGRTVAVAEAAVNCHHNYVAWEHHFGETVMVTRKGAVNASLGALGIIPGSMGAKSFIVRGKGNAESFCSCSHGAGRSMSRGEAKKRFSVADHIAATQGVECRKDIGVIDETPQAYKDIDAVMAAQSDLVEVVHTLKQVLCVKG